METRKLIKKATEEIGYIPNRIAGSLRSGRSETVAVIITDICNPLFAIWAKDLESELKKNDYDTLIINTDEDYIKEKMQLSWH